MDPSLTTWICHASIVPLVFNLIPFPFDKLNKGYWLLIALCNPRIHYRQFTNYRAKSCVSFLAFLSANTKDLRTAIKMLSFVITHPVPITWCIRSRQRLQYRSTCARLPRCFMLGPSPSSGLLDSWKPPGRERKIPGRCFVFQQLGFHL